MRWTNRGWPLAAIGALVTLCAGCSDAGSATPVAAARSLSTAADACPPDPLGSTEECRAQRLAEGQRLFDAETFGGNGRTCVTCHSVDTGTIDPAQVGALFKGQPQHPLFQHDGLDAKGHGTSRVKERATILVELALPAYASLKNAPDQRTVVVERGVPSTLNAPAFDKYFQWDLRLVGLQDQAAAAIAGHAQAARAPTPEELDLIAEFEATDRRFFSSDELYQYARNGGLAPALPEGSTEAEQRGRVFFEDARFEPPAMKGFCSSCHSGPMLNEPNIFFAEAALPSSPITMAQNVRVSEANRLNLPLRTYLVFDDCGNGKWVTSADPGLMLTDPWTIPELMLPPRELCIVHPASFANVFKIAGLRGIARTAPYFHDNSAATLEDAIRHYNFFLDEVAAGSGAHISEQDVADIAAFLRLL
jgi:hypothetical protein